MNGYFDLVTKELKANGWRYNSNAKGSHQKWEKSGCYVIVPFNCKSRHTANGIMKSAGIQKKF